MKVLLTGHHGYIGSVMEPELIQAGHEVTGWDIGYYRGCDFGPDTGVSLVSVDFREMGEPERLRGFDAIVHYAALSNDPLGALDPELTEKINFRATLALAKAAKEAGVNRFIFASSCSIYGAGAGDNALDETSPMNPLTAYAVSKVRSEEELSKLASDAFTPIYMRNATAFGVSPRLRADLVLNNLTGWAVTTGMVKILSDGSSWRPVVHVRDISRAAASLLDAPREAVHNQAFNVGMDSENFRVKELAEIVRQSAPGTEVEILGRGEPDTRSYRVSFRKLHKALPNLKLEWPAKRGAQELYEAYRLHGLTLDDFQGRKYIRLKQLEHLIEAGELDRELRWRNRT